VVGSVVYRSLLARQRIAGVDRNIFLFFFMISIIVIIQMRQYWFIFVSGVFYLLLYLFCKYDDFALPIFWDLISFTPTYVLE